MIQCHSVYLRDAGLDLGQLALLAPQLGVDSVAVDVAVHGAVGLVVAVRHALVRIGPAAPALWNVTNGSFTTKSHTEGTAFQAKVWASETNVRSCRLI